MTVRPSGCSSPATATEEGLGLPLPAGRLMLFDSRPARPFLVGEAVIRDHAVGEDVEIGLGAAPGVRVAADAARPDRRRRRL